MKRILLLVIIPLSLLMTSCVPVYEGDDYYSPYGEERMGPTYVEPFFLYEESPPHSFRNHDHDGHRNHDHDGGHHGHHKGSSSHDGHQDSDRGHDHDFHH